MFLFLVFVVKKYCWYSTVTISYQLDAYGDILLCPVFPSGSNATIPNRLRQKFIFLCMIPWDYLIFQSVGTYYFVSIFLFYHFFYDVLLVLFLCNSIPIPISCLLMIVCAPIHSLLLTSCLLYTSDAADE